MSLPAPDKLLDAPVLSFPFASSETRGGNMSLESIKQQIREEVAKLNQVLRLLGSKGKQTKAAKAPRRKLSVAGRKRIAAAQRARWAKIRAAKK